MFKTKENKKLNCQIANEAATPLLDLKKETIRTKIVLK